MDIVADRVEAVSEFTRCPVTSRKLDPELSEEGIQLVSFQVTRILRRQLRQLLSRHLHL
jgi:hypothetical protein